MEQAALGAWQAIVDAVLPVVITVLKVVFAGATICLGAQQTVEWAYSPLARRIGNGVANAGETKRLVALGVGVLSAMVRHWCNAPSFGDGPKGWVLGAMAGFLGGGFAGKFRDWGEKKWFVPTRAADASSPAGGGQP